MAGNERRGKITKVPDQTSGVIFSEGEQLFFDIPSIWMSQEAPQIGMVVAFSVGEHGNIIAAHPVDAQTIAKEKMQDVKEKLMAHGDTSKNLALAMLSDLNKKMGTPRLLASLIYGLAFFFMPFFSVGIRSFTPWNTLGAIGILSSGGTSDGHGLIGILGIIALLAPFASPFIKQWWTTFLNLAPVLYIVIFCLSLWLEIHESISSAESSANSMFGSAASGMMNGIADRIWNMVGLDYGAYVWAISAIIIGASTLRSVVNHNS